MGVSTAACWMLIVVSIASVSGKPVSTIRTQKRQSDQRVAELETLLALRKHFLRAQSGDGGGRYFPGYGVVDFNKIGRKKKAIIPPPPPPPPPPSPEINDWVLPPSSSSSAAAAASRSRGFSNSPSPSNEILTGMNSFRSRNSNSNKINYDNYRNWSRSRSSPSLEDPVSSSDEEPADTLETEIGN